jgi:hypothetical protein
MRYFIVNQAHDEHRQNQDGGQNVHIVPNAAKVVHKG